MAVLSRLLRRVRESKCDLLVLLATSQDHVDTSREEEADPAVAPAEINRDRSPEDRAIEWLNQHPCPSPAGRCAWCGAVETAGAVIVPFGTEPGTHTWLHAECWPAWQQARRAQAQALSATVEK